MKLKGPSFSSLFKKTVASVTLSFLLTHTITGCQSAGFFAQKYDTPEAKEAISEQLDTGTVALGASFKNVLTGISVDGTTVSIELSDGTILTGNNIDEMSLSNITGLDYLYIQNSEGLTAHTSSNYLSTLSTLLTCESTSISISNISVSDELKIMSESVKNFNSNCLNDINISSCKNIWVTGLNISQNFIRKLNRDSDLQKLYIADCKIEPDTLTIASSTISTILIENLDDDSELKNFDFTNCPNLQICSIGNQTEINNLNGLTGLQNLRVLGFGSYVKGSLNPDDTFYEKERNIQTQLPDSLLESILLTNSNNTFISDISVLKNLESLETLNISLLNCVTDKQLLDVVQSLPNLKHIIGLEVNNAIMYSDELVEYCTQNSIEHPFTEKSKAIKEELKRITSEIITPDMSEEEKVKAISMFIVDHMEYDFDACDLSSELSPDILRRTWGEKLYYSLFDGLGVCDGYETLTHALLLEAGITSYRQEGIGHTWEIVELDDNFYQLDTTNLDYYLASLDTPSSSIDKDVPYYLESYGDENYQTAYTSPQGAVPEEKSNSTTLLALIGLLSGLGIIARKSIKDISSKNINKFPFKQLNILLNNLRVKWGLNEFIELNIAVFYDTEDLDYIDAEIEPILEENILTNNDDERID